MKHLCFDLEEAQLLVAQCSVTPASVAAPPPCSATPFQGQLDVADTPGSSRATGATGPFRGGGCSAILLLHLKNPRILRKSAATSVARQGVPEHVRNYGATRPLFEPSACPVSDLTKT